MSSTGVVELRGGVHGTLADGHEIELLDSRTITADDVVVARRLRNLTLGSTVTARQPGRGRKLVAFLVPQSIWTPIGGMGAAVFGYFAAGATGDDPKDVETPEPIVPTDGDGFPVMPVVLAAALLLVVAFTARRSGGTGFALVVALGVLVGVVLNVLIT